MQYKLKALQGTQGLVTLFLDAPDAVDARRQAERLGYRIISLREKRGRGGAGRGALSLALFSQELLALLSAGMNLLESLETLAEKEQRADTRDLLNRIIARLREGQSLSVALQAFPGAFPALYIATVRASERTGDLREALERYLAYQSQLDVIRKKLVSASIYPLLLIIAGGLVMLFLLSYVVPRFSRVYEDVGGDLPWLSQLLLDWGRLVEAHSVGLLLAGLCTAAAAIYGATRPRLRRLAREGLWRAPAVGARLRIYELARFYRTLGMLLRGGTPVVSAIDMADGLLSPAMRGALRRARSEIREGRAISDAMERNGLTTPVALRMLRVGERTGAMGEMMERIAAFYDEDMARWVDWFSRLIEPLLMAFIGLAIGLVVILMYFPIFELAGSLQ